MPTARFVVVWALGVTSLFGCAGSAISPEAVSPAWAQATLHKSPDVVIAVDVDAIKTDRFFGPIFIHEVVGQDEAGAVLARTSRIDVFATASESWLAVFHGAGDAGPPPWPLLRRRWPQGGTPTASGLLFAPAERGEDEVWLSVRRHEWLVGSSRPDDRPAPGPVDIDGHAVMEAWVGPDGVAAMLARARPAARDALRAMRAARLRIDGGDAPGVVLDARFTSPEAAEQAEFDLTRQQRELAARGHGSELARQIAALVGQLDIRRAGPTLHVGFHATPAFRDYMLAVALAGRS